MASLTRFNNLARIQTIYHFKDPLKKLRSLFKTRSFILEAACLTLFLCLPCFGLSASLAAESSAQHLRSPANQGGPEDWPEDQGLSTSIMGGASPSFTPPAGLPPLQEFQPETAQSGQAAAISGQEPAESAKAEAPVQESGETRLPGEGSSLSGKSSQVNLERPGEAKKEETPAPPREVIYVDEAGNPVDKPLEPEKMLAEAAAFMDEGKYDDALQVLEKIKAIPNLPRDLLEKTLYGISDCLWGRYIDNPLAGYEPIVSSTNEAMNANLRSSRVPDALLRLGLANINVGNLQDAKGYITALMRRFPDFPGVAQGFTALGQAQLKAGRSADAEQSFGIVLDKYPESSQLQAASVGLAKALVEQGKDERAHVILDFISKRWPRYYINDPDFLLMQAANDKKLGRDEDAMTHRWLYVNLEPKREANAPLLLKMGDEYLKNGNPAAAKFVYAMIEDIFPSTPSATTAHMRIAEKGIYDAPVSYTQLSKIFNKNARPNLWQVYSELADSPDQGEDAILARLKQVMWLFWDKQYPEAMGKAVEFIDNYPEHSETPEARNLLWNAFQKELAQSLEEHNYGRILLLWNGFPYIRERYGAIDPPLRYALAQGWLERGDEEKSFQLMGEFLKDPMDPNYGEAAFSQFFNNYLKNGAWDKILELGNLVKNWKMKPELQNQLDYALALSAQNLNLGAPALERWKRLANRTDIPLYQQAYATYFVAKDAENRRDIKDAYELNRKVVEMFTRLSDERSDKADPERIKESVYSLMDICEVGNRVPEALQWAERYSALVGDDASELPGFRTENIQCYKGFAALYKPDSPQGAGRSLRHNRRKLEQHRPGG